MKFISENITPDAFAGAIYAIEGIRDAAILLNGPTGCKFYYGAIAGRRMPRGLDFDPVAVPEKFFFRQDRIPCTYLDGHDYVYGAEKKIREMLQFVQKERDYAMITLLNSPGAALIGDDLESFLAQEIHAIPYMAIESIPPSTSFGNGFQDTLIQLLQTINWNPKGSVKKPSVNLLGLHLYQKHYEGDIEEVKRLLNLLGVEVNTVFAAGDRLHTVQSFRDADLNIVLYPEFGEKLALFLEKEADMPFLCLEHPPIGFDAISAFIQKLATYFDLDSDLAFADIEKARGRAWQSLNYFSALTALPKGASFAIKGDPSQSLGLFKFLHAYLGMIPQAIHSNKVAELEYANALSDHLKNIGMAYAFERPWEDVVFNLLLSDGNTIGVMKAMGKEFADIEIALPEMGYEEILPRTLLGSRGALYLIEMVINQLKKTL